MGATPKEIFISYRREDVPFAALLLKRDLERRFGEKSVFVDTSIEVGRDFRRAIWDSLRSAPVVLIVIGPNWEKIQAEDGRRRIDLPDDWVRREARLALRLQRAVVVRVHRELPPPRAHYPSELAELADLQQPAPLRLSFWDHDLRALVEFIEGRLGRAASTVDDGAVGAPTAGELRGYWAEHVRGSLGRARLGTNDVALVDVYVESGISTESAAGKPEPSQALPHDMLQVVLRARRDADVGRVWLLFGDPGSGKSTVLRHVAMELAAAGDAVPVYIPLALWSREVPRENEGAEPRSVWRFAADRARRDDADAIEGYLKDAAKRGEVVLLLDGFDEVSAIHQSRVLHWIGELARDPRLCVVVASRPIGQGNLSTLEGARKARVQVLDEAAQRELVAKWVPSAERQAGFFEHVRNTTLRRIAPNPLLLSLLAWRAERVPADKSLRDVLPKSLGDLYDEVTRQILAVGYKALDLPGVAIGFGDAKSTVAEALSEVALDLLRDPDHDAVWPEERVIAAVRAVSRARWDGVRAEADIPGPERFVVEVARTGLWSESEGAGYGYRFLHRSLGEALAARALAEVAERDGGELELERVVGAIAGDEARWAEAFALFVARVSKGDSVTADRWLRKLAGINPLLARRALCWVEHATLEVVQEILKLPGDDRERRCGMFGEVRETVGDPVGAARLLGRLAKHTADFQELHSLAAALDAIVDDPAETQEARDEARRALAKDLFHAEQGFGRSVPALAWCRIDGAKLSFDMGSSSKEVGRHDDEGPVHRVDIMRPFEIAATPVTNRQWKAFRPEHEADDDRPVVYVTWFAAACFCRWAGGRLPSEAEWECAGRGGTGTRYWSGDGEDDLKTVGWYGANSERRTRSVAQKPANAFGLYDVHGNVWEWCEDAWHGDYEGAPSDGSPWIAGGSADRVIRGGSFWCDADWGRAAYRLGRPPDDRYAGQVFRPARFVT